MSHHVLGQVAAAVVMSMTPCIYGTTLSFGGLLLAESSLAESAPLSIGDAVMAASAANIGRMAACLLAAPLNNRLGVLRAIQLATPLNLLAWPLMTLSRRVETVLAGATLAGAVVGLTSVNGRLFIAEVTTSQYRPVLCYFPGVAIGVGLLISFSLSGLIQWRYAIIICGIMPSVIQIVGTILLPNSPRWLMNRGHSQERVRRAITFYRGEDVDLSGELKAIREAVMGRPNLSIAKQIHLIFTDWDVGRPCLLMFIQFTFETFCGGVVLTQFAQSVFQQAVQSLSPTNCTQILAGLQTAAIICNGCLLQFFGRKTVLIGAALLTCLGQLAVAAFFQFPEVLGPHQWIVVVGIAVANAACMGGISMLSYFLISELLPIRVRQLVGSVVSLHVGALGATFLHLFPMLNTALGSAGLFAALAGVNVLQMLFAYFCLVETKGLTLEEIQNRYFSKNAARENERLKQEQKGNSLDHEESRCGDQNGTLKSYNTFNMHETGAGNHTGNNTTKDSQPYQGVVNMAFQESETSCRRRNRSESNGGGPDRGSRRLSRPQKTAAAETSARLTDEHAGTTETGHTNGTQHDGSSTTVCPDDLPKPAVKPIDDVSSKETTVL